MKQRWYRVVMHGAHESYVRRLSADARDAVREATDGTGWARHHVGRVIVQTTGEVVPEELWK